MAKLRLHKEEILKLVELPCKEKAVMAVEKQRKYCNLKSTLLNCLTLNKIRTLTKAKIKRVGSAKKGITTSQLYCNLTVLCPETRPKVLH